MAAPAGGLFESLKGFAGTALEIARTRLELLSTELAEERIRLGLLMTYAVAAVILLALGLVLAVISLAVIFWEQRILLFVLATVIFFASGALAAVLALRQLRGGSRLFAASLGELAKDRAALIAVRPGTATTDPRLP